MSRLALAALALSAAALAVPARAAVPSSVVSIPARRAAAPDTTRPTHALRLRVLDAHEGAPLPGASVRVDGTASGASANADGLVRLPALPAGRYVAVVSFVGYAEARVPVALPAPDTLVTIRLDEEDAHAEELTVQAFRTSRTLGSSPTRVEVIAAEEIEEKIAMDPSGLSTLLSESPGIVVQTTSAVSGGAAFRVQGLDGRYTQLLRDGYPLYGGFAGGLSLLQVPPLDLAAVEVVKGPASTLYGGDAVAGIVNLVPKRPSEAGERTLLLNATSAGGADVAGYYARRGRRTGVTALVSAHAQRAYDAEGDGFTNLPGTQRLTAAPTVYRYGRGTLQAGLSATAERRDGGDVDVLAGRAAGFAERNRSARLSGHVGYTRPVGTGLLRLRASGSGFRRSVEVPTARFAGRQTSAFAEGSRTARLGRHEVVAGVDARLDAFDVTDGPALGHRHAVAGAFVQDTWDVPLGHAAHAHGAPLTLEAGLRADLHRAFGAFLLPRASVLVRPAEGLTLRATGGLGYKAPTAFVEAAETRAFAGVAPLGPDVKAERSAGGSLDATLRRALPGGLSVTVGQALFLTRLRHALTPVEGGGGATLALVNANGTTQTAGSETTARLSRRGVTLFLGYVYLDAHRDAASGRTHEPLTAQHRTYSVLVWEKHGRFRLGAEAYHTGPQRLSDGTRTPSYWIAGLLGERRFGRVSVFANLENVLDARQTRSMPLVTGPRAAPTFPEVWGPTDGFVANGGLRLSL